MLRRAQRARRRCDVPKAATLSLGALARRAAAWSGPLLPRRAASIFAAPPTAGHRRPSHRRRPRVRGESGRPTPARAGELKGAAEWMLTQAPAAAEWAKSWPEMKSIRSDYLGYPAHTELLDSTYCCANDAQICELISSNTNLAQAKQWQVTVKNNVKMAPC